MVRARPEPFAAVELQVGVLFGDDEDESPPAAEEQLHQGR